MEYRKCIGCVNWETGLNEHPCDKCFARPGKPNFKPKQVYISTADSRKNDLLVAARNAMQTTDAESLYPTVEYKPMKIDLKELKQLLEMQKRWTIDRPLNRLYGVAPKEKEKEMREPKKVIFNDPATIVFWHDRTITVVKAIDEPFDPEKGLAMAFAKKYLGNEGNYYNTFKKWLPKEEEITIPPELEKLVDAMKKIATRTRGMK